jgi:hypothetical protein
MGTEQKGFVDFLNGGDTGQDNIASVQPVSDNEGATQLVLRRPTENIRSRTEILRDEIEELKYYRDYGHLMIEYTGGTLDWAGPGNLADFSGGTFRISPMLAPGSAKKGSLGIGMAGVNRVIYTIATGAYATHGMNAITVEHRDGGVGTALSAQITAGPVRRILVVFDSTNTSHHATAAKAVIDAAIAADTGTPDLTGKINVTVDTADLVAITASAETRIEGTADDEVHVIQATDITALGNLAIGDGVAVWYRYLIEPDAGFGSDPKLGLAGGRAESSSTRGTSAIPSAALFKTTANPEKIPGAIPICKVASNGQLVFYDGTRVEAGATGFAFKSYQKMIVDVVAAYAAPGGAALIGYAGGNAWHDGTGNGQTTVELQLDKIVDDLADDSVTSGAKKIGLYSTNFSGALTATGGGGLISTDEDLQVALERVNTQLVARRAFTGVVTDGTTTVGGDINSATPVPTLMSTFTNGGSFMFRCGAYNIAAGVTYNDTAHWIGERAGAVTLTNSSAAEIAFTPASVTLTQSFENIYWRGTAAALSRTVFYDGNFELKNCVATAGVLIFSSSAAKTTVSIDNLQILVDDNVSDADQGVQFVGDNSKPLTGTVRNLSVKVIPAADATTDAKYALRLSNMSSYTDSSLVFENCTFSIATGFGLAGGVIVQISSCSQPVVFRGCVFACTQASATVTVLQITSSSNIIFEDCTFTQDGLGKLIDIDLSSNVHFKRCKFYTSTLAANEGDISVGYSTGTIVMDPVTFEKCHIDIRFGSSTFLRRIRLNGGAGSTQESGVCPVHLYDVSIKLNYSNTGYVNSRMFAMYSLTGVAQSIAQNLTFDLNSKELLLSNDDVIYFGGDPYQKLLVKNLELLNVREPVGTASYLVQLLRTEIDGGHIVPNANASGTRWQALFYLNAGSTLKGVRYAAINLLHGHFADVHGTETAILDNVIEGAPNTSEQGDNGYGWFVRIRDTAERTLISRNHVRLTADGNFAFSGISNVIHVMGVDCVISANIIRTNTTPKGLVTAVDAARVSINGNVFRLNSTGAFISLNNTTSSSVIGNILQGTSGTASISDTGGSNNVIDLNTLTA